MDVVAEPSNKIAYIEFSYMLSQIHNNHRRFYRSGVSSIKILEEKVETLFMCFVFDAYNPFFDYVNRMLADLAAGGFLSYWQKLAINPKGLIRKIDEIGPQVLTMEHLGIGFQICLVACAICVVILMFEIVFKRLGAIYRRRINAILLQQIGF